MQSTFSLTLCQVQPSCASHVLAHVHTITAWINAFWENMFVFAWEDSFGLRAFARAMRLHLQHLFSLLRLLNL